ncbi:protein maternal effect lethal 26-like [Trichogramma pretiosum]|uniref:protein maternal effect lethal 26-like n=1 Tax=Trichogramma pretiosum TaxID=7493 RepID=UPI0006C95151|nr:protein maternal effect lethal 26-like [Trichogramma pretiosum]
MTNVNEAAGHSLLASEDCYFMQIIDNIELEKCGGDTYLDSQIFSIESNEKFYLRLMGPSGTKGFNRKLYLCSQNIVNEFVCRCTISIDVDGEDVMPNNICNTFKVNKGTDTSTFLLGIPYYFGSIKTTTIRCELELSRAIETSCRDSDLTTNSSENLPLVLKFDWIFLSECSDVVLSTDCGKKIPAHRTVLAAASPVFKTMLSNDPLKNKNQSINLTEVSYDVAFEIWRYIYTGNIKNNDFSLASDVLAAADKYQLEELINKCGEVLRSKLSSENVIQTLAIADKYSLNLLKKEAVEFVKGSEKGSLDFDEISNMLLSLYVSHE